MGAQKGAVWGLQDASFGADASAWARGRLTGRPRQGHPGGGARWQRRVLAAAWRSGRSPRARGHAFPTWGLPPQPYT
eukprot:scaffold7534_cov444-Prasinococcus_capsulatus_cf.AAC.1